MTGILQSELRRKCGRKLDADSKSRTILSQIYDRNILETFKR